MLLIQCGLLAVRRIGRGAAGGAFRAPVVVFGHPWGMLKEHEFWTINPYSSVMDLSDIRRLVIVAMFSDDVLFGRLVLKGGNAISLVYGYGTRGSLDVDFSIDGDFDDLE